MRRVYNWKLECVKGYGGVAKVENENHSGAEGYETRRFLCERAWKHNQFQKYEKESKNLVEMYSINFRYLLNATFIQSLSDLIKKLSFSLRFFIFTDMVPFNFSKVNQDQFTV